MMKIMNMLTDPAQGSLMSMKMEIHLQKRKGLFEIHHLQQVDFQFYIFIEIPVSDGKEEFGSGDFSTTRPKREMTTVRELSETTTELGEILSFFLYSDNYHYYGH